MKKKTLAISNSTYHNPHKKYTTTPQTSTNTYLKQNLDRTMILASKINSPHQVRSTVIAYATCRENISQPRTTLHVTS